MEILLMRLYALGTMASPENLIPVTAAAKLLKVTTARVRDFIHQGRLPAQQVGKAYVLKRSDVLAFEKRKTGRPKNTGEGKKPGKVST